MKMKPKIHSWDTFPKRLTLKTTIDITHSETWWWEYHTLGLFFMRRNQVVFVESFMSGSKYQSVLTDNPPVAARNLKWSKVFTFQHHS